MLIDETMNILKRFIFNRLFNEHQRNVIWHAIIFSEHTYKRRGNTLGANKVRGVIDEIEKIVRPMDEQCLENTDKQKECGDNVTISENKD